MIAEYWAKIGESEKALAELDELFKLEKLNVQAHFHIGTVYELLGQRERAVQEIGTALRGGYSPDQVQNDPYLSDLWRDPSFQAVVQKLGTQAPG